LHQWQLKKEKKKKEEEEDDDMIFIQHRTRKKSNFAIGRKNEQFVGENRCGYVRIFT
jgi:hypothetical protein